VGSLKLGGGMWRRVERSLNGMEFGSSWCRGGGRMIRFETKCMYGVERMRHYGGEKWNGED
jgi:hypothetical protein